VRVNTRQAEDTVRRRPAWLNRNVFVMSLTSLLSDWGHEMATAALPGFAAIVGIGPLALGAIEGIADGLSSVVKLWAGRWSDRLAHRKAVATAGYAITGASKALFAIAHGWPIVLAGRSAAWFGRGIRGPVRDAMLAESVPAAGAGRAFGFHRASDTLGAILGPASALFLLAWLRPAEGSYRTIFLLTLVPGLLSAVVFGLWTSDPRGRPKAGTARRPATASASAAPGAFRLFLVAIALFGVADFAPTLLMLRASDVLSPAIGAAAAGTLVVAFYTLRNVVNAIAAYPVGVLGDRLPRTAILAAGYALLVVVATGAAAGVPSRAAFAALFVLSGVVAGVQDVLERASIVDFAPAGRLGAAYGALAAVNGVGDLCSSLLIGAIWRWSSPTLAFGVAAACAAAGAAMMATVGRQVRRQPA
jgi:MFS family permease